MNEGRFFAVLKDIAQAIKSDGVCDAPQLINSCLSHDVDLADIFDENFKFPNRDEAIELVRDGERSEGWLARWLGIDLIEAREILK